mgnify:CR=1 FL=1
MRIFATVPIEGFSVIPLQSKIVKAPLGRLKNHHVKEITAFMEAIGSLPLDDDIIILQNNTTIVNKQDFELIIKELEARSGDFDLCYLCRWLDRCDLLSEVTEVSGTKVKLARSQIPNGAAALYITSRGRKKLLTPTFFDPFENPLSSALTAQVAEGTLKALVTVPNIVHYEYLTSGDYYKSQECRVPPRFEAPYPKTLQRELSFLWFLLVVLGVLLIAYWVLKSQGLLHTPSWQ